jgi:hypothetical protein
MATLELRQLFEKPSLNASRQALGPMIATNQGQIDLDGQSGLIRVYRSNGSPMRIDNALANRQSESSSCLFGREKWGENALQ